MNVIEMNKGERTVLIPEAIEQGNSASVRYNAMRASGKIWSTGLLVEHDKIRRRIGWKPGILNHNVWKQRGMRWRTFEKLRTQHDAMASVAIVGIVRKLRLFER